MTAGICRLSLRQSVLGQQRKQSIHFRPQSPKTGYVTSVGRNYYRTDSAGMSGTVTLRKRPVTHSRSNGTPGLFDGLENLHLLLAIVAQGTGWMRRDLRSISNRVEFLSDRDHQCGRPTSSRLRNL